ncbi:MAG TPA: tetratricopeptide repeat protein [Terriglobia bacterium]|nr:tetratricopeptide repeat protein [Terriglobia bacterium]
MTYHQRMLPPTFVNRSSKAQTCSFALLTALLVPGAVGANQGAVQGGPTSGKNATRAESAQSGDVERALKQAVALRPDSFEANHRLGEFYLQSGRLKAGIPYLEQAQHLDPAHYVNGYDLALAYLETGDLSHASRQIRGMLGRQNNAELHNLLGETEEKAGHYVSAANEFQTAAHMDPSEKYIFDWGNELLLHRGYEPAVKVFTSGVERYPNSAMLHIGIGVAFYSLGFYDDAAKALCRATDLVPADPRPYLFLGQMFDISLSQSDEVTRRLKRFADTQPRNALASYYYAMSLWKGQRGQGLKANKDQITSLLERSATLDPRSPDPHLQLGILYAGEQKYGDASREFQQAIRLKPDLADAHYRLAQVYSRTGQKALAEKEFELYRRFHQQEMAEDEKRRNQAAQLYFKIR